MAVRNNIGKIKSSLEKTTRRSNLFYGLTQYGLGNPLTNTVASSADTPDGNAVNKDFLWGIHRWGSNENRIGK